MPARRPDELTSRVPLSTDWMMITPTDGPTFKCAVSALPSGAGGVTSVNTLTGAVVLAAGTNVTLVPVGNTITVNSTAAEGVTSLNALTGDLSIVAGANITVTPSGSSITITGASGGGGGTQTGNNQTGTTYTFVLADKQALVTFGNALATTVTIPANASVAFDIFTGIDVLQLGAGTVTFAPASGVTLNGTPGLRTRAQYSGGTLLKVGINTWVIVGDTMV